MPCSYRLKTPSALSLFNIQSLSFEEVPLSLYLKQIEQLVSLQKVDDAIHAIHTELEQAPRELEALRQKFEGVSSRRSLQADKMVHLHEQEKRLGIEIEDETSRIKKSKSKLMAAANSKEYNAMMREMDSLERMNRDREVEKVTLIEELTTQAATQKDLDEQYATLESCIRELENSIEERMSKARAAEEDLLQQRASCSSEVPAPIFGRYEFIRERLKHPVIVPVTGGVCSGCHISIPPQSFIELQKGTQILSCPKCQRLMYWVEHFTDSDTPPKAAPEQEGV